MSRINATLIYQNNHVDIVYKACKLCYLGKLSDDINEKLKYIENKIKNKHEAVLEHSNIVMLIEASSKTHLEYAEVLEAGRNLNSKSKQIGSSTTYLISGSIRAFKNIFRNIKNQNNSVAKAILMELHNINKEYFYDFIEAGIMSENRFNDTFGAESYPLQTGSKKFSITNIDDPEWILEQTRGLFDIDDILDMCSVTVFFEDLARIISQMVTRHRNGICQKSQRYVDEFGAEYSNPLEFSNYLPMDMKFKTSEYGEVTLEELANKMGNIYNELKAQGLHKEDARYYLPQNVKTQLYVTFTFRTLIHFLSLRVESAAQAEIREISILLNRLFTDYLTPYTGKNIFTYIMPKYMAAEVNFDMSLVEEVIEEIHNDLDLQEKNSYDISADQTKSKLMFPQVWDSKNAEMDRIVDKINAKVKDLNKGIDI